jgi:hypothetical protein
LRLTILPKNKSFEKLRNSGVRQLLGHNGDRRPDGHRIKDLDNIVRPHPDATVTARFPKAALLRCPVNIDAAFSSVLVAGLFPFQPENPGYYGITASRISVNHFAAEGSMPENCSLGQVVAQFSAYAKLAKRGLVTAGAVSETEL